MLKHIHVLFPKIFLVSFFLSFFFFWLEPNGKKFKNRKSEKQKRESRTHLLTSFVRDNGHPSRV